VKIIWIASYPRSGNTWVRAFISNLLDDRPPVDNRGYSRYVPHEAAAIWYKQFPGIEETPGGPQQISIERRRKVQEELAASMGQNAVLLKTHNALVEIEGLPLIRSDITASAIYIARDPRDVAVSLAASHDISIDDAIEFLSKKAAWVGPKPKMGQGNMFEFLGNWSDHVRSWAKAGSAVIRYEDLFERFDAFELIASFVKVYRNTEGIKKAVALCKFEKLKKLEEEDRRTSGRSDPPVFRNGEAGAWKKVLTPGQANRIEFNHADVMRRLRYLK
jgi:hypothetical protein